MAIKQTYRAQMMDCPTSPLTLVYGRSSSFPPAYTWTQSEKYSEVICSIKMMNCNYEVALLLPVDSLLARWLAKDLGNSYCQYKIAKFGASVEVTLMIFSFTRYKVVQSICQFESHQSVVFHPGSLKAHFQK